MNHVEYYYHISMICHLPPSCPLSPYSIRLLDTVQRLKSECNAEVEVVTSASSMFRSVSQYYQSFESVSGDKVIEIMKARSMHPLLIRH